MPGPGQSAQARKCGGDPLLVPQLLTATKAHLQQLPALLVIVDDHVAAQPREPFGDALLLPELSPDRQALLEIQPCHRAVGRHSPRAAYIPAPAPGRRPAPAGSPTGGA